MTNGIQLTIALLLLLSSARAQDAASELRRINEAYMGKTQMELHFQYVLYADTGDAEPLERQEGLVRKAGENLYHRIGEVETLQNGKYHIVAEHSAKILLVNRRRPSEDPAPRSLQVNLAAALDSCRSVTYGPVDENTASYTLEGFPRSEYETIRVTFDRKTFALKKVELYYKDSRGMNDPRFKKPKLDIVYGEMSPAFPADAFSEKKYITWKGKTARPAAAFSTYRFVSGL